MALDIFETLNNSEIRWTLVANVLMEMEYGEREWKR